MNFYYQSNGLKTRRMKRFSFWTQKKTFGRGLMGKSKVTWDGNRKKSEFQ